MKLKTNDWYDCIEFGNRIEKLTIENFHLIFKPIIEKYLYSNCFEYGLNPAKQKQGIDGSINLDKPLFEWDSKARDSSFLRFGDILLETISIIESKKIGWFFYSKADIIDYLYVDKNTSEIVDGYLIIMENAKKVFTKEELDKYPKKIAQSSKDGHIWHTENRVIPYKDFPKNSLINIKNLLRKIKEKELKTKNLILDKWLKK